MYWVKTEELRFDWVDNYAAQNLISCKYVQIYFRYIASQWGGWHILHDDEMTAGFDDNIALSFWFHTFLAPNTMHCLSAMKGIFLFVWFSFLILFQHLEWAPAYFPLVEKHFLFFAQALNCWIPAEIFQIYCISMRGGL